MFLGCSSETEEGELDDWLQEFAANFGGGDTTGPAVGEPLANLVSRMLQHRLPDEKVRELLDKNTRPTNIPLLVNPKVNSEIWSKLKEPTKKSDLRLAHVGDKVVKVLIASVKHVSQLTELRDKVLGDTRKSVQDIAKQAIDFIQLGTLVLHELL